MNRTHSLRIAKSVSVLMLALAVVSPVFAVAEAAVVNTKTTTAPSTKIAADRAAKIIERSDSAILARIADLQALVTRMQEFKYVTDAEKALIAKQVQTNIDGLTALKAKIDAETDVTALLADEKTITGFYRIYALVIPQGYIFASVDRTNEIADMLTTVSGKLQTRITEASTAGKNVTSITATLSDMNVKIALAKTEATTAFNLVSGLVPDQGDKTKADANHKALVDARSHIRLATEALHAARKDADTITRGLKAFHLNATSTPASIKGNTQ